MSSNCSFVFSFAILSMCLSGCLAREIDGVPSFDMSGEADMAAPSCDPGDVMVEEEGETTCHPACNQVQSSACLNGSICYLNGEMPACLCKENSTGPLCNTCTRGYMGPMCNLCASGYMRDNEGRCVREQSSDPCASNDMCQNGGTCVVPPNQTEPGCMCVGGFKNGPGSTCTECQDGLFLTDRSMCEEDTQASNCKQGEQDVDGDGTCHPTCERITMEQGSECDGVGQCVIDVTSEPIKGKPNCDCLPGFSNDPAVTRPNCTLKE